MTDYGWTIPWLVILSCAVLLILAVLIVDNIDKLKDEIRNKRDYRETKKPRKKKGDKK